MLEQVGEPRSSRYLVLEPTWYQNVNGRPSALYDRPIESRQPVRELVALNGILIESEAALRCPRSGCTTEILSTSTNNGKSIRLSDGLKS